VNLPLYFHEFARRAADHGLTYVSEALVSSSQPIAYPAAVADVVRALAKDPIETQQMLDFASNRAFRQSVLCRDDRTPTWTPGAIRAFHVSSPVRSVGVADREETFAVPWGWTLATADPSLRKALTLLGERWPASIPSRRWGATASRRDFWTPSRAAMDRVPGGAAEVHHVDRGPSCRVAARPAAGREQRRGDQPAPRADVSRRDQPRVVAPARRLEGPPRPDRCPDVAVGERRDGGPDAEGVPVDDPAERRRMLSEAVGLFLRRMADAALLTSA
jgi:hypothetical protein